MDTKSQYIISIQSYYSQSISVTSGSPQNPFQWPAWPCVVRSNVIFLTSPNTLFFFHKL